MMFMPRKPHHNGLLIYCAAGAVKGHKRNKVIPYMLMMMPHLQVGDSAPYNAVKSFMRLYVS